MTDPRTQAYQRHAAQRALVVLSADSRIRVVDPTVRQTIKLLAEHGLLRLPAHEAAGAKARSRQLKRTPVGEIQPLLRDLTATWSNTAIAERTGLSRGYVRRLLDGTTKTVNSDTRDAIVKFHSEVYNPAR